MINSNRGRISYTVFKITIVYRVEYCHFRLLYSDSRP